LPTAGGIIAGYSLVADTGAFAQSSSLSTIGNSSRSTAPPRGVLALAGSNGWYRVIANVNVELDQLYRTPTEDLQRGLKP
jgi:hypothetical protein